MGADNSKKRTLIPAGAPAWVVTFADMMSILLCFFIMLLSMSEPKREKFQDASGSMRNAFGIHNTYVEERSPMNEKIVNQQFAQSPAKPVPANGTATLAMIDAETDEILNALKTEKDVEVLNDGKDIIIRLPADVVFANEQASLQKSVLPTLKKITAEVTKLNKYIVVSSHSDNQDLKTKAYRSKWDLTSARSVTVALAMMKLGNIDAKRFTTIGQADTRPILENSSAKNQAKNRRLDIVLKNEAP
ncbi:MAG: OmpA family protein [Bdellovibrionales bacterium]|nr:OmpA family protein [Bdellovibrionales bacterium]